MSRTVNRTLPFDLLNYVLLFYDLRGWQVVTFYSATSGHISTYQRQFFFFWGGEVRCHRVTYLSTYLKVWIHVRSTWYCLCAFLEYVFMCMCRPVCVLSFFFFVIVVILPLFVVNLYSAWRMFQRLNAIYKCYLPIYVSIYLSMYVCMYVCIYLSIYLTIYLSVQWCLPYPPSESLTEGTRVCLTDSWASVGENFLEEYLTKARHGHLDKARDNPVGTFPNFPHASQGACGR